MRYVYSVVRYVPNPTTGEFVNIGAIAGSDASGDWSIRQAENPRRARLFGPSDSLTTVFAFMNDVGRHIDDYVSMPETSITDTSDDVSEAWLAELQRNHRNVIQLSPLAPVLAETAEEALAFVFEHLIDDGVSNGIAGQREYATRRQLFAELRSSYKAASIRSELIQERACLETATSTVQPDFIVGNGVAVQLAHTWSFEIQSYLDVLNQVKSWGYTMTTLRRAGGQILGDHPARVDADIPIAVIFAPPRSKAQIEVFEDARKVWNDVGAAYRPRDEIQLVADEARKSLSDKGVAL